MHVHTTLHLLLRNSGKNLGSREKQQEGRKTTLILCLPTVISVTWYYNTLIKITKFLLKLKTGVSTDTIQIFSPRGNRLATKFRSSQIKNVLETKIDG